MGSEQSSSGGGAGRPEAGRAAGGTPVSPQNSICSDTEVPYVSYTHNLPISDAESPRTGARRPRPGRTARSRAPLLPREIVVVRAAEAAAGAAADAEDAELRRLKLIPAFLPVMRAALAAPTARDPDILDRLDSAAVRQMVGRLQCHLATAADATAARQAHINNKITQLDQQSSSLLAAVTERQRAYARHAERLQRVAEVNHQLQRCHRLLDDSVRQLHQLNQQLPEQRRLPPFLWTSG